MHPLVAIVRRSGVGRDEDRHTAVMIAAPVAGEVAGPPPGDDGTGRHQLVKHDLALRITRPPVSDLGPSAAEPLYQPHAADSSRVLFVVTRTGDESVQGHRHIQDHARHDSSKGSGQMDCGNPTSGRGRRPSLARAGASALASTPTRGGALITPSRTPA